jgi:3-oxoacyl-[acyl-carrier-protein] synthase-3
MLYSIITGSGSYVPMLAVPNADFESHTFHESTGEKIERPILEIIEKFRQITGINERRYVEDHLVSSDMAALASEKAITSSGINKEQLDYIIVAHNFGDVKAGSTHVDMVPTLAARVKHKLGIQNPYCIAYDLPFGCPGWLQGVIQADYYIKSGDAKNILVIGSETLSRISDPFDRDSMIYSDGAGAVVLSAIESDEPVGIMSHITRSDTREEVFYLKMDSSYNAKVAGQLYLKMNGRKLYEYALKTVPPAIKLCIEKAGLGIDHIERILIHQANEKMDDAIVNRLYDLYGIKHRPEYSMPMTIAHLGNNSVATLPILYDMIINKNVENHFLSPGDHFVFASVGAGMNVNAVVYKMQD